MAGGDVTSGGCHEGPDAGSHEATARCHRVAGASGWGGKSRVQPHAGSLRTGPGRSAVPPAPRGSRRTLRLTHVCCAALAHSGSATGPRGPFSQRSRGTSHGPFSHMSGSSSPRDAGVRRSGGFGRCWNGTGPRGTPSQGWLAPRAPMGAVFGVGKDVATWWRPSRGPAF